MATIAIGDIHGCLPPLEDLLSQLTGEVSDRDTIVFLGDYIDRGPDTKGCIDRMLRFIDEIRAPVVCLCGNHEDWLLRTRHDHRRHSWLLGMEAWETIRSYSPGAAGRLRSAAETAGPDLVLGACALPYAEFFAHVPDAHLRFFDRLLPCFRTADCVCVHGGLDPDGPPVEQQVRETLIWGAGTFPDGYRGAETIVYGHRNDALVDATGWPRPRMATRTIGVDTITHGVLTAVRLPDRRVFQSQQYAVGAAAPGT